MGKMTKRIVFGAILIAALSALLVLDTWLGKTRPDLPVGLAVACLLALLALAAFVEVRAMINKSGGAVLGISGLLGSMAIAVLPLFGKPELVSVALVVLLVFIEQMIRFRKEGAVARLGGTILAIGYVGVGMAMILSIRTGYGMGMLVFFVAAVKFTDIGAYFTGTMIGRHKLIPWLSPGKSWEGLAGGLVAAVAVSFAMNAVLGLALGAGAVAALAVTAAIAGQFGDLCESLLKRSAGVKDSGSLVPEFGGVLDMIDSPLLAAGPVLAMLSLLA